MQRGASRADGFLAGLLGAAAMALVVALLRLVAHSPSLLELLQEGLLLRTPGRVFGFLIDRLQFSGKPLLATGLLLGLAVFGGLLGWGYSGWHVRRWLAFARSARGMAFGAILWLAAGLLLMPLLGLGLFAGARSPGLVINASTMLVAWLVFGQALEWSYGALVTEGSAAEGSALTRRRLLAGAAVALVAGLGGGALLRFVGRSERGGGARAFLPPSASSGAGASKLASAAIPTLGPGVDPALLVSSFEGWSSPVTPTDKFYVISKNVIDPVVSLNGWQLEVGGMVESPLKLTYEQVREMPRQTQYATLQCISNLVGGDLMGNALWTGVPLKDLLSRARVKPAAKSVVFHCADDYTDMVALDKAMEDGTLAAYEMNGAALNDKHGFPLRIVVPDIYGMKNAKWVRRIEIIDGDFQGFWQRQGWSNVAIYKTTSRIDVPISGTRTARQPVTMAGVAFAGSRGIAKVEVSTDKGKSWSPAKLRDPLSPVSWVLWSYEWQPPAEGSYTIQARATDKRGDIQDSKDSDSYPDGASGLHAVIVKVA